MRSWIVSLAAVGFLVPLQVVGQEGRRCFEVVAVGSEAGGLSSMRGDTLILTRDSYSRGVGEVVWWQAFLKTKLPTNSVFEAIPWRPIRADSLELHLPVLEAPAQLVVQDTGCALRGYVRVVSYDLGMPDNRYRFVAEAIRCEESIQGIGAADG